MIALNKRDNALAWKERLGFADRHPPEYYEAAKDVVDAPHAGAIRTALEALGISAVFCVQDVPTIAILFVDEYEKDKIVELHAALWNQGLASLLLVATGETLRAFSLGRKPLQNPGDEFDRRCLIRVLNATADAIEIRNIVYGTESGRIWKEQSGFFKIKERVDQILLNNLSAAHEMLCLAKLKSNEAQALLMQAMFVSYLEDRKILTPDYFGRASKSKTLTFGELLKSGNLQYFNKLFTQLRDDFNGDLFVAPCSFQPTKIKPALNVAHLDILHRFRMGT